MSVPAPCGAADALPACVSDHRDGAVLAVYASPKSSRNQIGPIAGDVVRVRVTAAAVDGAANAALTRLLASAVGVPNSAVEVIAGRTSRRKRVLVRGINATDLVRRLGTHHLPSS